eukprot:gene55277-37152_t
MVIFDQWPNSIGATGSRTRESSIISGLAIGLSGGLVYTWGSHRSLPELEGWTMKELCDFPIQQKELGDFPIRQKELGDSPIQQSFGSHGPLPAASADCGGAPDVPPAAVKTEPRRRHVALVALNTKGFLAAAAGAPVSAVATWLAGELCVFAANATGNKGIVDLLASDQGGV